jgi:hypothetical protein
MHIPRSIVITCGLALLILGGCVAISTLAINQFRKDRVFMFQHCVLKP